MTATVHKEGRLKYGGEMMRRNGATSHAAANTVCGGAMTKLVEHMRVHCVAMRLDRGSGVHTAGWDMSVYAVLLPL